jgi:hypothetical protein
MGSLEIFPYKNPIKKLHGILSNECRADICGKTDRKHEANCSLSDYANAHKNLTGQPKRKTFKRKQHL